MGKKDVGRPVKNYRMQVAVNVSRVTSQHVETVTELLSV